MKKKQLEKSKVEMANTGKNPPGYELAICREVLVMFLVDTENKNELRVLQNLCLIRIREELIIR